MFSKLLEDMDCEDRFWLAFWGLLFSLIGFLILCVFLYNAIDLSHDLIYGRYPKEIPYMSEVESIKTEDNGYTIIIKKKLPEGNYNNRRK